MIRFLASAAFMLMILSASSVQAQEDASAVAEKAAIEAAKPEADKAAVKTEEIPEGIKEHQKAAQDVFELTKKIADDLSADEQKHFFLLYNNYNLIGTVKMVQEDVGKAVASCGEKNPDLKEAMDKRFTDWNAAVNPVIGEAEANVENMVVAQDYAKPADIKKVFKGLDKTRTLANAQIEKTPVTTKEACDYLLNKMNDTQDNFVQLLKGTLVSVPQAAVPVTKEETAAPEAPAAEAPVDPAPVDPASAEPKAE